MPSGNYDSVLRQFRGKQEKSLPLCPPGRRFSEKLQEVVFSPLSHLGERATRPRIQQAKLFLLDIYMEWHHNTPEHHMFAPHTCLAQIFEQSYGRLQLMYLEKQTPINYDDLDTPQATNNEAPFYKGMVLGFDDE